MNIDSDKIIITGASENNLKNINVEIPKGKLVVFTGVSGSGKSSLVFNTIASEAMRRLNDTYPLYIRNKMPYYKPPKVEVIDRLTTSIVIEQRAFVGDLRSTVGTMTDVAPMLRLLYSRCAERCAGSSSAYSFNDPSGMCTTCGGLGKTVNFDLEGLLDRSKSLNEGAILFPGHQIGSYQWQLYANSGLYDSDKPLCDFTEKEWSAFLHGSGVIVEIKNTTGKIWDKSYNLTYEGFLDRITRLYLNRDLSKQSKTNKRIIKEFTKEFPCDACNGARLNEIALSSKLNGFNISELGDKEICDVIPILEQITDPIGHSTAKKIIEILNDIVNMGIGYLNLNRPSNSLSGGEAQQLKVVRHLKNGLVGITYIFDEPSVGLHPKDVSRMNCLLTRLRDKGNTVLVVEHDKDVIQAADEVIDMGPGAGKGGGQIVFQGSVRELMQKHTATAEWLKCKIPVKEKVRTSDEAFVVRNANLHNLSNVTIRIPKQVLTVVCGLAGAGKSSLVCGELPRQYPEVKHISQAQIGTSSRSTSATYIGMMDEVRKLFAKKNRVSMSLFSSNSKGACPNCGGKGVVTADMAFLDTVTLTCEACNGQKFSKESLGFEYNEKNIVEVLKMTVNEALAFFEEAQIVDKLKLLKDIGMGYLTLGQETSTLSGGECQRLKLVNFLQCKDGAFVIDEPTTGLHGKDIDLLMELFDRMVDNGNTVIVVEHNLDVIKQADWVIDMGPKGGKDGGRVLFEGTPQQLIKCKKSATAECLRKEKNDLIIN